MPETKKSVNDILNSPEALALREKRDRLIKTRNKELDKDNEQYQIEITRLQKRVATQTAQIPLGDTDTIEVWSCLSEQETKLIGQMEKLKKEIVAGRPMDELSVAETEALNDITYQILEMVTANPLITYQWLLENPDKYSTQDMAIAFVGFYSEIAERAQRTLSIQKFRQK